MIEGSVITLVAGEALPAKSRTDTDPVRLLFLGQAIVRKGIHDLAAVARLLGNGPWQIDVVG